WLRVHYSVRVSSEISTLSLHDALPISDNRLIGHLGEAKRLKSEDPTKVVGVGGCWAQSVKDEVFEQFPFVDVAFGPGQVPKLARSEEHTSELQSRVDLVCRLLLEKKKQ